MFQQTVIATLTAKRGSEAALAQVLLGLVAPTRQESGCLRYDLHRDPENPGLLVFVETWETREALQAHLKTPHYLAAHAAQSDLLSAKDVRILEKI